MFRIPAKDSNNHYITIGGGSIKGCTPTCDRSQEQRQKKTKLGEPEHEGSFCRRRERLPRKNEDYGQPNPRQRFRKEVYKERNRIERMIRRLKNFGRSI